MLFSILLVLNSCNRDEQFQNNDKQQFSNVKSENNKSLTSKKYIYHATWDAWGRTSQGCKGFGLCHFQSCWFCEVGGNKNSGEIEIDESTKQGYLYIKLDPSDKVQDRAIIEKFVLYIDNDLFNNDVTLYKGNYIFDSKIGNYGGYKVMASAK